MNHVRTGLIALVALLILVVVLQNTESVDTRVLFVTLSLPRAVLLIVTLIVGFLLGLLAASQRRQEPDKKPDS